VRCDLPETDIVAFVDRGKVEQVLLNLLQNAIEASSPGAKVALSLRRTPLWANIRVEDEGSGLMSADAPIFDPFFSTKPQGTGLGLAIAHRIVTDHGGLISVTSRPGRTVFEVRLPLQSEGMSS
jgi:signal transduction histidine kinase